MYRINLTNIKTNEVIPFVFPSTSDDLIRENMVFSDDGTADYQEFLNRLPLTLDTTNYTLFKYRDRVPTDSKWDLPSFRIYEEFGYLAVCCGNYSSKSFYNELREGRWRTPNGKIIEFSGDGYRATLLYPNGTIKHFGGFLSGNETWVYYDSAGDGDCSIFYINDLERFLRTDEENESLGETKAGYGRLAFQRYAVDIENRITLTAGTATGGIYETPTETRPNFRNKKDLLWWNVLQDEEITTQDDLSKDPYSNGGYSSGGKGGKGTWYDRDDNIPIPSLPSIDATSTGMITIYNPTMQQLINLSAYLWSSDIEDIISKMWADPLDVMLGLQVVGCPVPSSATKTVTVAGRNTKVSMNVADRQFIEVDCGTVQLDEYYGTYMDYSPYTEMSIYLPFIGEKTLDVDIVMGKSIGVVYHCDILSGSAVCFITVNGSVKYEFNGNISSYIPFTSANYAQMISSSFGLIKDTFNSATGHMAGSVESSLEHVQGMKPSIHKSGNIGGTTGLMAVRKPYLLISRANLCLPEHQNSLQGYPAFVTAILANLKGYTEVESVKCDTLKCTKEEQDAIVARLKSGVIL